MFRNARVSAFLVLGSAYLFCHLFLHRAVHGMFTPAEILVLDEHAGEASSLLNPELKEKRKASTMTETGKASSDPRVPVSIADTQRVDAAPDVSEGGGRITGTSRAWSQVQDTIKSAWSRFKMGSKRPLRADEHSSVRVAAEEEEHNERDLPGARDAVTVYGRSEFPDPIAGFKPIYKDVNEDDPFRAFRQRFRASPEQLEELRGLDPWTAVMRTDDMQRDEYARVQAEAEVAEMRTLRRSQEQLMRKRDVLLQLLHAPVRLAGHVGEGLSSLVGRSIDDGAATATSAAEVEERRKILALGRGGTSGDGGGGGGRVDEGRLLHASRIKQDREVERLNVRGGENDALEDGQPLQHAAEDASAGWQSGWKRAVAGLIASAGVITVSVCDTSGKGFDCRGAERERKRLERSRAREYRDVMTYVDR